MSDNVVELCAHETMTVDQCLATVKRDGFSDILFIGYVGNDLAWGSSEMDNARALWLIEMLKKRILDGELGST